MLKSFIATWWVLMGVGLIASAAVVSGVPEAVTQWSGREGKILPVPVKNVQLEGGFWGPTMRIYKDRAIPHSWQYMGYDIRSLRKAAGKKTDGPFNNTWGEANLYKFLETIAHSLGMFPDPALGKQVDEIVELIGRAQRANGYSHVFIINEGKPDWDPEFLDGSHDGYVLGHLIEAAIEYQANTGKRALLEIASKAADEAYEHFLGPKGVPGFCGHAELEMALVELSRATGRTKYVELARAFVEWRGRGLVKPVGATPRAYFQDAVPLRQQVSLDGTNSFYQNPLSDTNHPRYNSWVCCPPNLSRTVFQVGRYAYASGEKDVFINLFVAGTVQAPLTDGSVSLKVETDYPWEGKVKIAVTPGNAKRFAVNLRWPAWCENATLSINGPTIHPLRKADRGYIRLEREWRENDVIEFNMERPVRLMEAHPLIKDCAGKVALQRGPLIYGFEGMDNQGKAALELGDHPQFQVENRSNLLGGVRVVTGRDAEGKPIMAVPFFAMANRVKTAQEVWTIQRGLKPSDAWWEGRLYRKAHEAMIKSVAPSPTEKDAK